MLSCFNGPMRITQKFGNDFKYKGGLYYARYGIKGHNGLDVVPVNGDKKIYSFLEGIILKIEFHPTYGNRVCIWNQDAKLAEYHCHMQSFNDYLRVGLLVEARTYLGKMGNTGKSMGAHNHIGFVQTDSSGMRINRSNGYLGWVDPLTYLEVD